MTTDHTAQVLVNTARSVMSVQRDDLVGTWPRAAALLGRQALEHQLGRFWQTTAPGVEATTMRAQLICLPVYLEPALARRVRYAWHALSAACHHHAYELPPIAAELDGWLDEVEALIGAVR